MREGNQGSGGYPAEHAMIRSGVSPEWKSVLAIIGLLVSSAALPDSFFDTDDVLELELEGPLHTLIDNKEDRTEYPFTLREGGIEQSIKVRVRGKSRIRVCDFPPLRLRFGNDTPISSAFADQEKIKLVTHCRGEERGEKNVVEEYAAYRIFNLLSDVAYRVRLARIRYIDSEGRLDELQESRMAFFIEPKATLARRAEGAFVDYPGIKLSWLNHDQASLVYVFQYWIGNTDWSLVAATGEEFCCHNGDLLEIDSEVFYVPYDFDLSGLVSASYAKPDPALRLRNVSQRRYRGYCIDRDALQAALQRIKTHKEEIVATIESLPLLNQKDKDNRIKYLGDAFKKSEKEVKMLKSFEKYCLGGDS
jgi:hypothetical protein